MDRKETINTEARIKDVLERNAEIEVEKRKKNLYLILRPDLLKSIRQTSTKEGI